MFTKSIMLYPSYKWYFLVHSHISKLKLVFRSSKSSIQVDIVSKLCSQALFSFELIKLTNTNSPIQCTSDSILVMKFSILKFIFSEDSSLWYGYIVTLLLIRVFDKESLINVWRSVLTDFHSKFYIARYNLKWWNIKFYSLIDMGD